MKENVVLACDVFDAYATMMGSQMRQSGVVEVIDVVWWMTGLSPTKHDVEPIPNRQAWKIVRRWPKTGEYHAGRVDG